MIFSIKFDGKVAINKPPNAVSISEIEINFLGANLSASVPPYTYDISATIPYIEKQLPSCKFVNSKTSKKVGLNIRAKTKGKINTDSPAKISNKI
jgi:phage FluMu protein Com